LHLGDFFDRHPRENAQFHQLGGLRIAGTELGKGLVQVDELVVKGDVEQIFVRELAAAPRPALTLAALSANLVESAANVRAGRGAAASSRTKICSTSPLTTSSSTWTRPLPSSVPAIRKPPSW